MTQPIRADANDRTASSTALGVASLRAAHLILDDPPPILDDKIAVRLLGPGAADQIRDHADAFGTPGSLGLRTHVLLRSRHAEDLLGVAVGRGIRQYLMLGAGLDTFAYRQPPWARDLRLFEVDHPASQAAKLERLAKGAIDIPGNLTFVAADFEHDRLPDTLTANGFDAMAPAFVSCLGVLPYLDPATVERLLAFVASLAPPSEFVATFARPAISSLDQLAESAARLGEPWRSRFEPADVERLVRRLGFTAVSFLLPEEAQERYFRDRQDGLRGPRRVNTVVATV